MRTAVIALALLLSSPACFAAKFGDVGRPPTLPQDASGRDLVHCETVRTIYSDVPQQACVTAGQRMTAAANAEAAASQKALSARAMQDARAAQAQQDLPSR